MSRYAIIHRSESKYGNQWHVEKWHRERGWGMETSAGKIACGYHFLLLNARPWGMTRAPEFDGQIVPGRPLNFEGAHCRGWNKHVGICYVGMEPTPKQRTALRGLCQDLLGHQNIDGVYGHDEILKRQGKPTKGCPGFDMDAFRKMLR